MPRNRFFVIVLSLIVLTVAMTSPATAVQRRGCESVKSTLETVFVDTNREIGQLLGTLEGAASLNLDESAPAVDPQIDLPNLVIKNKLGTITMWVQNIAKPGTGWREIQVLYSSGRGFYGEQKFFLNIYGQVTEKAGSYVIEGIVCNPTSTAKN